MSIPAEILSFTCGLCGEELKTTSLSTEVEICGCGATALDQGTVQIFLNVGEPN